MQRLTRIFSLFTVFVFLFALGVSGLHSTYQKDTSCESTEMHFHKAENHCILCDFAEGFSAFIPFNQFNTELKEFRTLDCFVSYQIYPVTYRSYIQLRGPPHFF
jgi:hypothetical protein